MKRDLIYREKEKREEKQIYWSTGNGIQWNICHSKKIVRIYIKKKQKKKKKQKEKMLGES